MPNYNDLIIQLMSQRKAEEDRNAQLMAEKRRNEPNPLEQLFKGGVGAAAGFATGGPLGAVLGGAKGLTSEAKGLPGLAEAGISGYSTGKTLADTASTKEAFANMLTKGKFTPEQQAVFKLAENSPDLQKELFSKWAGSQFDKPVSPEVTATKLLNYIEPVSAFDNETMTDKEGAKVFEYSSPLLPGIKYWRMKKNVSPYAFFGGNQ